MSTNGFYYDHVLTDEQWDQLSAEGKLQHLQDFENYMARRSGRPAKKVVVMSDDLAEKNPAINGYFSPQEDVIYVNPKYLRKSLKLAGVSRFSYVLGLELIAHEGRHAWQWYAANHPEAKLMDDTTRMAIVMNFENYRGDGAFYGAQLLERDARLFAREVLMMLREQSIRNDGCADKRMDAAIRYSNIQELAWAQTLRNVTEDQLKEYDEKCRVASAKRHPGVDFSGVSIYGDAIRFKRDGELERYLEMKPIGGGLILQPDARKVGAEDEDASKVGKAGTEKSKPKKPVGGVGGVRGSGSRRF